MLYKLTRKMGGIVTIIMIDEYRKVKAKLKELKASQRTHKIEYGIEKTDETEKYVKKHKFRSH